ncbi:putative quinone oxidoreductase YhfP [compost metagenome]
MISTMKVNGVIGSIGMAASPNVSTSVFPFILRGVSLLGVNSTESASADLERETWRRLASDLKPAMLKDIARVIAFDQLPGAFEDFIQGRVRGRLVVDLNP